MRWIRDPVARLLGGRIINYGFLMLQKTDYPLRRFVQCMCTTTAELRRITLLRV